MSTSSTKSNRRPSPRRRFGLTTSTQQSDQPGRHRFESDATPAQHTATDLIQRHGGDLQPRTRRAR